MKSIAENSTPLRVTAMQFFPEQISVPGDKSISHRSVMFSGLAKGKTHIKGFLPSEDCMCSLKMMVAMGAKVRPLQILEQVGLVELEVEGVAGHLQAPNHALDCGNSGTSMRLFSGILATQSFSSELFGDASLSKRPMKRVADPLALMGAKMTGQTDKICAPIRIEGAKLNPIDYSLPVASAQVKSAILLAGMLTQGKTSVHEPVVTRDHTERMMAHFQVNCRRQDDIISIEGPQVPIARDITVPGDISSAAFWLVMAAAAKGKQLKLVNVGLNPTRIGILKVLERMGANITIHSYPSFGEPCGDIIITGAELNGTVIEGAEIANVIDELPILAVAGALAKGTTLIRDAHELRVKETDRISAVVNNLRLIGAKVEEFDDGMSIVGGFPLTGATLPCFGDHRIAMAFAIAGLYAQGEMVIENPECIATSYPSFFQDLALFHSATPKPRTLISAEAVGFKI
jgi:3-phosphoshikimate 1-carboxyvinyltransferase